MVSVSQRNDIVVSGVSPSHEQSQIVRLGTGIDEKNPVQVARRELGDASGELELLGMSAGEGRDEVQLAQLRTHCVGDFPAAVARVDAKQSRRTVENLGTLVAP